MDSIRDRQRRREARSQHGVAATVALARAHGVRVQEPVVLNDLFSLMVHLPPAPVVARVSTCMPRLRSPIAEWLGREISVTAFLAEQGVPVAGPSRELPPGPHVQDGFAISFWTYLQPDPDRVVTAADCSAMLVDLHAVLRGYPGELPMLCADDMPRMLEKVDPEAGILNEDEITRIRTAAEQLRPLWEAPAGELQPLHGDAHPGNVLATRDGLAWIDFEDVSRGPVEWDLATMMAPEAVAAHHRPDPELMDRFTQLRALQVALVLLTFSDEFGDIEGWDEGIRSTLSMLPSPS